MRIQGTNWEKPFVTDKISIIQDIYYLYTSVRKKFNRKMDKNLSRYFTEKQS